MYERNQEVKVSIFCTAYNHEKYIRTALESFINQKVNFQFEVLVHDDASTDKTADIIREYEKKYPDIIKPIYQTENQYSKKIGIWKTYLYPRARGKYIAICEGDDCWIDENKLQMQVDYMESHPDCTFCFSNAKIYVTKENKVYSFMNYFKQKVPQQTDFNLAAILHLFNFIPTCTFLFPKENRAKFPEYYDEYCFGGDRKLSLYSIALGYGHYINCETGKYNYGVENSATHKQRAIDELLSINESFIRLAHNLDTFTNHKYRIELYEYIQRLDMERLYLQPHRFIQYPYYKNLRKAMSIKQKLKLFLELHCAWVLKLKRKILK